MTEHDGDAFQVLLDEYHEAFRDRLPLTTATRKRYWDSLVGYAFDRVATAFQRCFDVGKYKGLPLPGVIIENMPAVRNDAPFQLEDMRPDDSPEEVAQKVKFTRLCAKTGKVYRTGMEWRTAYETWKQGGGND